MEILLLFLHAALLVSVGGNMADCPDISPWATRGMIIDAGSGGSRLHVYKWAPRIFDSIPPPISFPTSEEKWTARMDPGIATLVNQPEAIKKQLSSLIDFAVKQLHGNEGNFSTYPIYFKATGGMRELARPDRDMIMNRVRSLLSDKSFSPFFFRDDFARIISGEEEAIFSWTAVNFLMGSLLPASEGSGSVVAPLNSTLGSLDLGGSSTQIAFFTPDQNILEGLFKLQIGAQKHWNVYTKSFLKFGINSAKTRYFSSLADSYVEPKPANKKDKDSTAVVPRVASYCLHTGHSDKVADSSPAHRLVEIAGPAAPAGDQLERCMQELRPMMYMSKDSYCHEVYHSECSIGGEYQPPLPTGKHGHFVGTSSYQYPWNFLMLPPSATLEEFKAKASQICSMNFHEVLSYYETNNLNMLNDKLATYMPYYCFLSSYTLVLLQDGYGFPLNQTITVVDQINGNKLGWALGAILYEINIMPWEMSTTLPSNDWKIMLFSVIAGSLIGAVVAFLVTREMMTMRKHHVTFNAIEKAVDVDGNVTTTIAADHGHARKLNPQSQSQHLTANISQYNPFRSDYQPIPTNNKQVTGYGSTFEVEQQSV